RWTMHPGPYRALSEEQARAYDEVGCFVVPDAFDPATVAEMMAETDPAEAELDAYLRREHGGQVFIARADEITFTTHLVARSERLRHLVSVPPLVDLVADLVGP